MTETLKKTFEVNLTQLEKIVNEIESGKLSLEESLKKFENGIQLYKVLKKELSSAEKKIKKLTDDLKEEDL